MMKRGSSEMIVGGSMIRVEEEGEDLDDVDDDEDEEEEGVDSPRVDQSMDDAATDAGRQQQQQQQQESSSQPQDLLGQPPRMSRGRRLGRRASSALLRVAKTSIPVEIAPPKSALPAAGDKGLQPHFLKKRSITIMDLGAGSGVSGPADASAEQPPIPQSKASAFLMSILAKSRAVVGTGSSAGYAGGISANHALRPLTTNSLHYKHHGVEQSHRLRPHTGGRRAGRALSSLYHDSRGNLHHQLSEGHNGENGYHEEDLDDEDFRLRQLDTETPREMIIKLQRHRQQLPDVIAILTRIHRRLHEYDVVDEEEQLPLCAAFIDAEILPTLAALMREFRFHAYLHVSVVGLLTVLSTASDVFAYIMSEIGFETILQKSVTVHATHERLVLMTSALLHAMEESKTATNIQVVRAAKAAKEKHRSTYFSDLVNEKLGLSPSKFSKRSKPISPSKIPIEDSRSSNQMQASPQPHKALNGLKKSAISPLSAKRALSGIRSASRLRRLFSESLAPPPSLSAHYNIVTALSPSPADRVANLSSSSTPQFSVLNSTSNEVMLQNRPSTTPVQRSMPFDIKFVSSSKAATEVYGDSLVFVEPSPLLKRLPHRGGISSAGGVRKQLNVRRSSGGRLESLTPRASQPTCSDAALWEVTGSNTDHLGVVMSHENPDETFDAQLRPTDPQPNDDNKSNSDLDSKVQREVQGPEDEDEEEYEDDFAPADDGSEDPSIENPQRPAGILGDCSGTLELARVDSDSELMDMLPEVATPNPDRPQESQGSKSVETREFMAATCIQRRVRGMHARSRVAVMQAHFTTNSHAKTMKPLRILSKKRKPGDDNRRRPTMANAHSARLLELSQPLRARSRSLSSAPTPSLASVAAESPTRRPSSKKRPSLTRPLAKDESTAQREISQVATSDSDTSSTAKVTADSLFDGPDPLRRLQDLYAEGLRLHRTGQVAEAAACYERALELAPASGRDFASVHLNLGSARMTLGDSAGALEAFRQARRVKPDNPKAAFNEALALLHLGRTREATAKLREVLKLDPKHERAREAIVRLIGDNT